MRPAIVGAALLFASAALPPGTVSVFAQDATQATSPALGSYECYAFSDGRLVFRGGLNFAITGPGQYSGVDGQQGAFTFDGTSQVLTFRGAALDGQRARYDGAANPRTITFLNARGELGDSCDLQP